MPCLARIARIRRKSTILAPAHLLIAFRPRIRRAQPILTANPLPAPFIVLDACVLMSGIVRRLVLRLAEAGVYQPVWTERIGEEWRRNASRIWEIPPEVMAEQWADMNARFRRPWSVTPRPTKPRCATATPRTST